MGRSLQCWCAGMLALVTVLAAPAAAQRRPALETRFGLGFSRFIENEPGAKAKTGMAGAIAYHVPLNNTFSVQTELGYVMKGTSYGHVTDPDIGGTVYLGEFELLYATDYIELPVMMRMDFGSGSVRPSLLAGPVLGWKVVEKLRLNGPDRNDYEGEWFSLRSYDVAVAGGVGFEFGPPARCLTLEGRYCYGLIDVLKPEYQGSVRNTDYRIQLGWKSDWSPGFGSF